LDAANCGSDSALCGILWHGVVGDAFTMRFLFLLLVLSACAVQDCRFAANVHLSEPIKNTKSNMDIRSTDNNQKTLPDIQDLKERVTPGGQYRCVF
jgi:hypothetical protein